MVRITFIKIFSFLALHRVLFDIGKNKGKRIQNYQKVDILFVIVGSGREVSFIKHYQKPVDLGKVYEMGETITPIS